KIHNSLTDIMIFLYVYILCVAAYSINADQVTVSATLGSTVVLPCEWRDLPIETPHVEWTIGRKIVFERKGRDSFPGEGYEGRVDVPEDELNKGNCSLVLKNVRVTDDAEYRSSMLVKQQKKSVLVQEVQLSVYNGTDKSPDKIPDSPGGTEVSPDSSDSINAAQLSVTAAVGSTVVLPCEWRDQSVQTPHVVWTMEQEVVFERKGKDSFQAEGYEGRVDVPEDELNKGNCSLVLKNVRVTDEAEYRSSMLVENPKKSVLVQEVQLSVYNGTDKSPDKTPDSPGGTEVSPDSS
ncbi:uncharacterized protein DAT39_022808, partial [Clarias magur]